MEKLFLVSLCFSLVYICSQEMKRYSILLLFSILFTNATVVGILDLIPFILHKISIEEIIKSSDHLIEKHSFHKSTFNKIKIDAGEFKWQGYMYDIVSSTTSGDSICVIAYRDVKESLILSGIEDHSKNETSKSLLKKALSLVYFMPEKLSLPTFFFKKITPQKNYFKEVLTDNFLSSFLRPPSFIL
jgi:hypothetical protein